MYLYTLCKVKSLEAFVTYYHAFPKGSIIKKPTYTYWKSWHGPLTSERKTSCWLCNLYATVRKKKKALSKVQHFLQVNKGHLEGWNVMRYLENYRKKKALRLFRKNLRYFTYAIITFTWLWVKFCTNYIPFGPPKLYISNFCFTRHGI